METKTRRWAEIERDGGRRSEKRLKLNHLHRSAGGAKPRRVSFDDGIDKLEYFMEDTVESFLRDLDKKRRRMFLVQMQWRCPHGFFFISFFFFFNFFSRPPRQ